VVDIAQRIGNCQTNCCPVLGLGRCVLRKERRLRNEPNVGIEGFLRNELARAGAANLVYLRYEPNWNSPGRLCQTKPIMRQWVRLDETNFVSIFEGRPIRTLAQLRGSGRNALLGTVLVANSDRSSVRTLGAKHYGFRVLHIYPHDQSAFTQGLEYRGGFLYEGTGLPGRSTLRKEKLETGEILEAVNVAPELFGEGITVINRHVLQLTWQSHLGFVYDEASFRKLRTCGKIRTTFLSWSATELAPARVRLSRRPSNSRVALPQRERMSTDERARDRCRGDPQNGGSSLPGWNGASRRS
jgi:hypothetical protein